MKAFARFLCVLSLTAFCVACGGGGGGPANTGDASLSSLSVSGAILEPPFSSSVTSYVARVPYSTTSVEISATPSDSSFTVIIGPLFGGSSPYTLFLQSGDNFIRTHVIAEGHASRQYDIVVVRGYLIDTTVGWNGLLHPGAPFGDGGASEVFGQTFVVIAEAPTLQLMSFWLQHEPNDTSGEDLFFSVVVMAWDIDRATGPILYESQLQSITTAQSNMTRYDVDTGGVILVPGQEYVAFLSANNGSWNATSTPIRVGFQNSDVYSEGAAWTLDSDNNPGLFTSAAWDNTFGTADFVVEFAF